MVNLAVNRAVGVTRNLCFGAVMNFLSGGECGEFDMGLTWILISYFLF